MRVTGEMVSTLARFLGDGAPPDDAAIWAADAHRVRWASSTDRVKVIMELKGRADAMIRLALINRASAEARPPGPLPDWLVSFKAAHARHEGSRPAPPPPMPPPIDRATTRALMDGPRHRIGAALPPRVPKAWAILWAMLWALEKYRPRIAALEREAEARTEREQQRHHAESKGWRVTRR